MVDIAVVNNKYDNNAMSIHFFFITIIIIKRNITYLIKTEFNFFEKCLRNQFFFSSIFLVLILLRIYHSYNLAIIEGPRIYLTNKRITFHVQSKPQRMQSTIVNYLLHPSRYIIADIKKMKTMHVPDATIKLCIRIADT